MGPLIRLCLHHGVEPWFIPVSEPWRNGVVEKFNDHYQVRFETFAQLVTDFGPLNQFFPQILCFISK
jgi:transposase InsO family protein